MEVVVRSQVKLLVTVAVCNATRAFYCSELKKKRAREKETCEGRGSSLTPRVSPSRAPVLSFAHYFQAPPKLWVPDRSRSPLSDNLFYIAATGKRALSQINKLNVHHIIDT